MADPVSWSIFALQVGSTLWGMNQQQKQSRFSEYQLRRQAAAQKAFANEMYGLTSEQAAGVRGQGERTARQLEIQGKYKLMYMEDASKRRIGDMTSKIGASGVVINQGSARNAILTQGRADALGMRLQAAETKRMAAETRYSADTQAYYMMRSAGINRRNYMASASNWNQQANFLSASRPYQMMGSLLSGSSSIIQTQSMLDKPIWS
tara:strand:- start:541 stop:1161 length:621 start_codon:yes stop_codon:yes gene_type:complete